MRRNISYYYDSQSNIELILCEQSDLSYPLHNHVSVFTIGVVLDGSMKVTIGSGSRSCHKGDLFVVFPYAPHSIQAQTRYTLLSLCIRKSMVCPEHLDALKGELAALLNRAAAGLVDYPRLSALLDCLPLFPQALPSGENSPINALKRQLETTPEAKLSADEMAKIAATSKYHLIRTFKREVGLTPHQFQLQNRIRKAQRLLTKTDSMTEVALITGFFDQSHFIRYFEKMVGLTPTEYKRSCRTAPAAPPVTQGRG